MKISCHENIAVILILRFLGKIAFRGILISRFEQNYKFRDIFISRLVQNYEIESFFLANIPEFLCFSTKVFRFLTKTVFQGILISRLS